MAFACAALGVCYSVAAVLVASDLLVEHVHVVDHTDLEAGVVELRMGVGRSAGVVERVRDIRVVAALRVGVRLKDASDWAGSNFFL